MISLEEGDIHLHLCMAGTAVLGISHAPVKLEPTYSSSPTSGTTGTMQTTQEAATKRMAKDSPKAITVLILRKPCSTGMLRWASSWPAATVPYAA